MSGRAQAAAYGLLLVLAFGAGWSVNDWRVDSKMSLLKKEHSEQIARAGAAALNSYSRMERTKDEAIKTSAARADKNAADAGAARAAVDRLRGDLAQVPARIATASRAAVDEYAATAGELLGKCTTEYQRVAEAADRHLSNERLLMESWPVNSDVN